MVVVTQGTQEPEARTASSSIAPPYRRDAPIKMSSKRQL